MKVKSVKVNYDEKPVSCRADESNNYTSCPFCYDKMCVLLRAMN